MRSSKTFQRAAALLAAVSMSLSMSVSAFAAEYWIGDGDITIEVDENGNHYVTQVDKDGNVKHDKELDKDGNVTIKGGSSTVAHEENDMVDDGFAVAAEEDAEQPEDDTNGLPEGETDEQPTEGTEGDDNADENGEEENKTPVEEGEEETSAEEAASEEETKNDEEPAAENADDLAAEQEQLAAAPEQAVEPQADAPDKDNFFGYVIKIISDSLAKVTLDNVKIDASRTLPYNDKGAAMSIEGAGDVELELDGDSELKSGGSYAGLEKRNNKSTGNLKIKDDNGTTGRLTATGGEDGGAGIGGSDDSGNPLWHGSSNITITGGTVIATGNRFGAGIGGSQHGTGSNITITGGTVIATGGELGGAGIGGGEDGAGSNITITGGNVTAKGGYSGGAGIGGGGAAGGILSEINGHDGSNITITGGTVKATGGEDGGAGIGGAVGGAGIGITIGGNAVVEAIGGGKDLWPGAGIGGGGGNEYNNSDITVSGAAKVTAIGTKSRYDNVTSGATIGKGGYYVDGGEYAADGTGGVGFADISGLYKSDIDADPSSDLFNGGYIHHIYADGTEHWEYGTTPRPEPDTSDETAAAVTLPLHVENLFGTELAYTTVRDGGTLTLTVNDAFARLHGSLAAVRELQAQGVNTIVFVTSMQTTTVSVGDLLGRGADGDEFALRHDGLLSTLTVGSEVLPAPCAK